MDTTQLTAQDIADYFLSLVDSESGEVISNLKLQKLCYYAQGFHLAIYNQSLFLEEIEAWQHGPVVPILYHKYKVFGNKGIDSPDPSTFDLNKYPQSVRDLLDEIYMVYGQYSAWKLRDLTHEEPPWKDTFEKGLITISHPSMKSYFSSLVKEE